MSARLQGSNAVLAFTGSQLAVLVIIVITVGALLVNRLPPDLVALIALLSLGLSGLVPVEQALAGFSRPAVITIIGLFIISASLERTGVVQWLAEQLARLSGTTERRMVAVFMAAGALLSLIMNNIAAGAVLLPAAIVVAHGARVPPSKLLLPLGFSTLLGGMATLFTTANIIISGYLQAQGQRPLAPLDFLPIGGLTVLLGIGYMLLIGRRLLPARDSLLRTALAQPNLLDTYQLAQRLWEVRVLPGSPLVGQCLQDTAIGAQYGTTVVAIWHGREARMPPSPADVIAANDILLVLGREERVRALTAFGTTVGRNGRYRATMQDLPVQLTEVVIGPRAQAIGSTLKHLRFRSKFGLTAVGIWREGVSHRTDVGDVPLRAGDAVLMVGPPAGIDSLAQEEGFILPDRQAPAHLLPHKAGWAVAITAAVLLLAALNIIPTAEAMLAGAAGMVLSGCLTTEDAYRAIEWKVVVLIAGMAPIGTALVATGLAERLGTLITTSVGSLGPLALVVALYSSAVLLTQVIGGQVTALILGPIAVNAALAVHVNPSAVGVAVAMGCSVAFLTPIAHPVNILMMGPGGYTARDFGRVGLGMTLVCFVGLIAGMLLFWNLGSGSL
jgi:di/tricarboxylate transporter